MHHALPFASQPFAFIDPFGYSDTPMNTVSRLMRYYGCEVLITFMYEEINRFLTADYRTKEYQYDALFMKDTMWAVDPSGTYQFSDFTDQQQLLLFQPEPDYSLLKRMLLVCFDGETVSVEGIDSYVLEETPFRVAGYKEKLHGSAARPTAAD